MILCVNATKMLCRKPFLLPRIKNKKHVVLPRNEKQEEYLSVLHSNCPIVVATGPAGCGKTALVSHIAIQHLANSIVDKIVITRPAVCVDEQHGFLPGKLDSKMEPWTRPIFDTFSKSLNASAIQQMMKNKQIEICPLAFMRGRTFDNAFVICDESQNCTPNQMLMILTRIGENSKLVITGDLQQHDRGFENNGLLDLLTRIEKHPHGDIHWVQFESTDIERHHIIPHIINMYK